MLEIKIVGCQMHVQVATHKDRILFINKINRLGHYQKQKVDDILKAQMPLKVWNEMHFSLPKKPSKYRRFTEPKRVQVEILGTNS